MSLQSYSDLNIDAVLRPISAARRVLRDHQTTRYSGIAADDPPSFKTIAKAADAVAGALTAAATPETARPVIMQMLTGKPVSPAVAQQYVAAITCGLPLVAVASATSRYRGAIEPPSPERFLRECLKAQESIVDLLDGLNSALTSLQRSSAGLAMIVRPVAASRSR